MLLEVGSSFQLGYNVRIAKLPWGRLMTENAGDATQLLRAFGRGEPEAAEKLLPLVYAELRSLAAGYFRQERPDHTLEPTALVHEAFMRLVDQTDVAWKDRTHFFAVAATAMRHILTDHARKRNAAKRGGNWERITLADAVTPPVESSIDVVALDNALTRLAALDTRKHRIVELRFFGGLTVDEVARVLEVSRTTVESDWRGAKAWLSLELSKEDRE